MTIAADLGDGGLAVAHSADVDLGVLDSRPRRAAYRTELGRGLVLMPGREDEAIEALLTAHATSPARVATSRYVLAALDELLARPLRRPSTRARSPRRRLTRPSRPRRPPSPPRPDDHAVGDHLMLSGWSPTA